MYNSIYIEFLTQEINDEEKREEFLNRIERELKEQAGDDVAWDCRAMLTEALGNAMDHGNLELRVRTQEARNERLKDLQYARKKISVHYLILKGCVSLTVYDEGKGFNHNNLFRKLRNGGVDINQYKGMKIISYLADEFYFNEKGNALTMMKYFNNL